MDRSADTSKWSRRRPSAEAAVRPELHAAARSLRLDREAAAAVEHLRSAGIRSILLKGAAIATWLYDDGVLRPYIDIDLLVSPAQFEGATKALADLGYRPLMTGADPAELGPKELDLIGPTNVCIDLHHGLLGASAPPGQCWEVLASRTATMRVGGTQVEVLDVPARSMHLALHAAQNGPVDVKALADLERGLAKVSRADWKEAARVAEGIGATEAFAAGLRLVPAGRTLADEFGLTHRMTVELALRTRSVTQDALFFERFAEAHGPLRKGALLARKLFPTSVTLRANSALARRGRLGTFCARLLHPFQLAVRFIPAFFDWAQAKLRTRRD